MNVDLNTVKGSLVFFDTPDRCIANFENKHWLEKVLSIIKSYGTLLYCALDYASHILNPFESQVCPVFNVPHSGYTKKRLIVCIHGLNNNPSQFKTIIDKINKKPHADTDVYIPHVLQNGNAKLDQMVQPILAEIIKWAKTEIGNELVLIGVSNGARIARAIETELAKSVEANKIKTLRFISIVGACKGTPLVNWINKLGLSWVLSKNIAEEMPSDSERNLRLDKEWLEGLSAGPKRNYTFIASPHDWYVTNYDSTLMDVSGQKAWYTIVSGHGHNSILNDVAEAVAELSL
jgi:hypothetical protein